MPVPSCEVLSMPLVVSYGVACLSLYVLTAYLFRSELGDVLDAYHSHAMSSRTSAQLHSVELNESGPPASRALPHPTRLARRRFGLTRRPLPARCKDIPRLRIRVSRIATASETSEHDFTQE